MATSTTAIANRALQILGDKPVLDISDNSPRAKACNRAYDPVRRAELRAHAWNFARKRVVLAPDSAEPAFDFAYQYSLPADCVRILPQNEDCDWTPEGGKILTDDGDTLNLIYIRDVTAVAEFDALFDEAIAAKIAKEICEEITGSTTKWEQCDIAYKEAIREARRINAFEQPAQTLPVDDWLIARY